MNLKSLFSVMLILVFSNYSHAFTDYGVSKSSCKDARIDAKILAEGHCNSLGTRAQIDFGKCFTREKQKQVRVNYSCQVDGLDSDYNYDI